MLKTPVFSKRVENLQGSPIREALRSVSRGVISFAGGLPDAESFPSLRAESVPARYLQYGPTEGEPELRDLLAKKLQGLGIHTGPDQILILSGSQQGIDLAAKLFVDKGSPVALESPTYLAALQVFRFFGARFNILDPSRPTWERPLPALLYLNPTFQNPTGRCLSTEERQTVAKECDRRRIPVLEDDPYRDLAYGPCDRTPICAFLKKTEWIYQGSFSKTLAPGLRIGFLAASKGLFPHLARLKQAADLHTNRLSQWLVLQHLKSRGLEARMGRLVLHYRGKRDRFARVLKSRFSGLASWSIPQGGLFFWLALNNPLDTRVLFQKALRKKVAFMPGEAFFVEQPAPHGFLRLNFSHASESETEEGLSRLAALVRKHTP